MYNGMSIIAIVPARGGSKGIVKKNIKMLANKPLIAWTIEAAQKSKYIDRIILSTDDLEIEKIALEYGIDSPFLRPSELASDDSPTVQAIAYTINKLSTDEKIKYDYLLLLQPTSPLRSESHIDEAIEMLLNNKASYNALVSITELDHPVYWNRLIDETNTVKKYVEYDQEKLYRRQDFNSIYRLNGAIYLIETTVFLIENNFETTKTLGYKMDKIPSVDIDQIDDFLIAEYFLLKKDMIQNKNE